MISFEWKPGLTLDDLERSAILKVLELYEGNKTRTAKELGISLRCLRDKVKRYEMDDVRIYIPNKIKILI